MKLEVYLRKKILQVIRSKYHPLLSTTLSQVIHFFSFLLNLYFAICPAGHSVNSVNDKFHHGKISCLRQEPIVGGSIKKNILWNCCVTALSASAREKTRVFTRTSHSSQLFR